MKKKEINKALGFTIAILSIQCVIAALFPNTLPSGYYYIGTTAMYVFVLLIVGYFKND